MQAKLKIETMDTETLIPYADNPRIHSAAQIDTIAESIEQFGFNDPVGVWTNADGELEVVEGHGRVLAARKLGIEQLPVIRLDHLSDDARKAYTIVHNQTTDNSVWDFAMLDEQLEKLSDFDWSAFGLGQSGVGDEYGFIDEAPAEFKEFGEDIETEHKCPKCGYEW